MPNGHAPPLNVDADVNPQNPKATPPAHPDTASSALPPTIISAHPSPSSIIDASLSPIAPFSFLPMMDVDSDDAVSLVSLGSPERSPHSVVADLGEDEMHSRQHKVLEPLSRYLRMVLLAVKEPWSVIKGSLFSLLPPSYICGIACIVQNITTAGQTVWLAAANTDTAVMLRGYLVDWHLLPGVRLSCEFVPYTAYRDASSKATNQWLPSGAGLRPDATVHNQLMGSGSHNEEDANQQQSCSRLPDPRQRENTRQEFIRDPDLSRTSFSQLGCRGRSPRRRQHPSLKYRSLSLWNGERSSSYRRAACISRSPTRRADTYRLSTLSCHPYRADRSRSPSRRHPFRRGRSRSSSPRFTRRTDLRFQRRSRSRSRDWMYHSASSRTHFDRDLTDHEHHTKGQRYYRLQNYSLSNPLPVRASEAVCDMSPPIPFFMNPPMITNPPTITMGGFPLPSWVHPADARESVMSMEYSSCGPPILGTTPWSLLPIARNLTELPYVPQYGSFPTNQPSTSASLPIFQRVGVQLNDRIGLRKDGGERAHDDTAHRDPRVHSTSSLPWPRKRGKRGGIKHKLESSS